MSACIPRTVNPIAFHSCAHRHRVPRQNHMHIERTCKMKLTPSRSVRIQQPLYSKGERNYLVATRRARPYMLNFHRSRPFAFRSVAVTVRRYCSFVIRRRCLGKCTTAEYRETRSRSPTNPLRWGTHLEAKSKAKLIRITGFTLVSLYLHAGGNVLL